MLPSSHELQDTRLCFQAVEDLISAALAAFPELLRGFREQLGKTAIVQASRKSGKPNQLRGSDVPTTLSSEVISPSRAAVPHIMCSWNNNPRAMHDHL